MLLKNEGGKMAKKVEIIKRKFFAFDGVVDEENYYDWISQWEYANLRAVEKNGRIGFIDIENESLRIPFEYDTNRNVWNQTIFGYQVPINEDYIGVSKNGLWGLIDHYNNVIIDFMWDNINFKSLNEDMLPVFKKNENGREKLGFVNIKTGEIIEAKYDADYEAKFDNGIVYVHLIGKPIKLDKQGRAEVQD